MRHFYLIKKPTLKIALAGFLFMLSACQQLDVAESKCSAKNSTKDAKCSRKAIAAPSNTKTQYRRQFKVDPHHRSKARQVVNIDEGGATTFSANNPDYKHRNYLQSVINPDAHEPQLLRYQEVPGQARLRAGSLQMDALYARAQKEFKQSVMRELSADNALPLFAYSVDSGLALEDAESSLKKLYAYLSPYRSNFTKPEHFPGDKDGFQIAAVGAHANKWPQVNDRMHWVLAFLKVRHVLSEEQRKELELSALRALKNSIELDRSAAFDGVLGLYEGVDTTGPLIENQKLRENKNFRVNAFNYLALKTAAELAKKYQSSVASVKYGDWSVDLRNAINQHFWDHSKRRYRAFLSYKDSSALDQAYAISFGIADDYTARMALQSLDQSEEYFTPQESVYLLRAASLVNYASLISKIFQRFTEEYSSNAFYKQEDADTNNSSAAYLSLMSEGVFGLNFTYKGLDMTPTMTVDMRQKYFASASRIKLHDINIGGKRFNFTMVLPKSTKGSGKYRVKNVRVNGADIGGTLHWHEFKGENTVIVNLSQQTHAYQMATPQDGVYVSPDKYSKSKNKNVSIVAQQPVDGRSLVSEAVLLQKDIVIETEGSYQFKYAYTLPDLRKPYPHAHSIKWLDLIDAQGRVLASKVMHFPVRKRMDKECQSSPLLAHLAPGRYSLRMRDFFHMSYLAANDQKPMQNTVTPVALCIYREGAS